MVRQIANRVDARKAISNCHASSISTQDLDADRRLAFAQQRDYLNDPATRAEREQHFDVFCRLEFSKRQLADSETRPWIDYTDREKKEQYETDLRNRIAMLKEDLTGAGSGNTTYAASIIRNETDDARVSKEAVPSALANETPQARKARLKEWFEDQHQHLPATEAFSSQTGSQGACQLQV